MHLQTIELLYRHTFFLKSYVMYSVSPYPGEKKYTSIIYLKMVQVYYKW